MTFLTELETWGVVTGLVAVWLTVRQNVWCWPIGILNVGLYAVVFFRARLYADMGLQLVYVALCAYGWYRWTHPGPARTELPVTRISLREAAILAALGLVGLVALAHPLARYTDQVLPYWNSATVMMSLAAQWLQTRKILENWHLWIVADLISAGIYFSQGLHQTVALYLVYEGLAVAGLLAWRRSGAAAAAAPAPAAA